MTTVPFDTHYIILEWVYRLSQSDEVDYQTLAACALVCSIWVPTAQRLLFRRIPDGIRTGQPFYQSKRRVSITRLNNSVRENPRLGTYVRSLTVRAEHTVTGSDERFLQDVITLLGFCPNILAIRIPHLLAFLVWSSGAEAQLRALALRPVFLELQDGPAAAHRLLALWPSVRNFRTLWRYNAAAPPPPRAASLLGVQLPAGVASPGSLEWLPSFGRDASALREVEIGWPIWSAHELVRMFAAAPRRIRSLTTPEVPPQCVLEQLPRLEELIFGEWPIAMPLLPRSIRHVGYHQSSLHNTIHAGPESLRSLEAVLGTVASLQTMSATRSSSEDLLAAFEDMCRSLRAEFIVFLNPGCFPRARNVDWI